MENKKALDFLSCEGESVKEVLSELAPLKDMTPAQVVAAAKAKGVTLQYLERSLEMGLALYNVLAPEVPGYRYGPDSGVPTFSFDTLKEKGLI